MEKEIKILYEMLNKALKDCLHHRYMLDCENTDLSNKLRDIQWKAFVLGFTVGVGITYLIKLL
jgi:hypothetical protein